MLDKAYDPSNTEDRIYAMWEESGAFAADASSEKESFTISMPPPNATGQLHLGHAIMLGIQDIFVRYARMQGKEALWLPGTDHAAIATENVVIRKLQSEGMKDPRTELCREELVKRIAEFVEGSRSTIRSQVRKMGSSCDWSRERYTMEPTLNRCVNEVFAKMYDDGLIYRGHRIVNWDPNLQTTVSDDEMEYKEETVPFYTFQYGPFQIGTARPETKFGDKYVVMHPDDERYAKYKHGDTFECEWIHGPVHATIIKDEAVDPEFGTGVMTITPWHDATDFEIAERHGLEKQQIIDFDGKLMEPAQEFAGMAIEEARPKIVEKLKSKGLLVEVKEDYVHNKAVSQRGKGVIEPQIRLQWFIDVNKKVVQWKEQKMSLKEVMHDVVHSGDIAIIPDRFNRTYFHWIDNLRDWCVSRQIWWGHRVPVWYRGEEIAVGVSAPEGDDWKQDDDTLDTWFSSALWTWSTLIDASKAEDLSLSLEDLLAQSPDFQKFHPTSILETGYDILFFWVARMILMTTYATGQVPFENVYLHGMVRTRDGKKMSKSDPETMIDPLDIIPKYGADALRLSMIVGQSPGNDTKLFEEKIAGYRNFVNKLWNASRFVLMQCESARLEPSSVGADVPSADNLSLADKALLEGLRVLRADLDAAMSQHRLSEAGEKMYSFVWDFFCDWYLELSKGNANVAVLVYALRQILALLHPFCPFVTEEIWGHVKPEGAGLLISEQLTPIPDANADYQQARQELQLVIDVITAIRRIRSEQGVDAGKKVEVTVVSPPHAALLGDQQEHICRLAKASSVTVAEARPESEEIASEFLPNVEVHVSLEGLIDKEKELASLTAERAQLQSYIVGLEKKLGNEAFVSRAPAEVVAHEQEKLASQQEKLVKIEERLKQLK